VAQRRGGGERDGEQQDLSHGGPLKSVELSGASLRGAPDGRRRRRLYN
jgi:hypothetical protein